MQGTVSSDSATLLRCGLRLAPLLISELACDILERPMNVSTIANTRYTTKAFDPAKKIPAASMQELVTLLRQSPSSVNSQPSHFIVAGDDAGKARIAKGVEEGYAYNLPKVVNASHVIVLCSRIDMSAAHLDRVLSQEAQDGRFNTAEAKVGQQNTRQFYINLHNERQDLQQWMEKQTYLALGGLLLGAAALGIDATPMEGFDAAKLDAELGLREKGYTSVVVVALGYRSDSDFNAKLPKSRLSEADLVTYL